ncbi:MAG: hypothetical protein ACI31M_03830 [Bacilli bacterium]
MKIENAELITITGGGISATFLNAISRATENIYNFGRSIGSSIRRIRAGRLCPL